jgi:tryprostatin B 6-hydroxylase
MDNLQYPLAVVAGIASHLLYFHRGEHHMNGMLYLWSLVSVAATAIGVVHKQYGYDFMVAVRMVAPVVGYYLAGLYSSILIYRGALNPLNKFPGPFMARFSSFWWSVHNGTDSHAFLKNQELHKKYGPFVRITPNTLSIAHGDAPELLYGNKSKCRKSDWYDISLNHVSQEAWLMLMAGTTETSP